MGSCYYYRMLWPKQADLSPQSVRFTETKIFILKLKDDKLTTDIRDAINFTTFCLAFKQYTIRVDAQRLKPLFKKY